jgi:carbamoyl-phosphate synthase/aspartate carbamoyltransferase/dihydroorotase
MVPEQPETWVEIDTDVQWEIRAENAFTRCGWTPFEGRKVTGSVKKVILRGTDVFFDQQVLAQPGFGKNIRQ